MKHTRLTRLGTAWLCLAGTAFLIGSRAVGTAVGEFPGLASQMNPSVATESMMQLANVFGGRMDERKQWGYHLPSSWELFFDTGRKVGQITGTFKFEDVCKNDLIDQANAFDKGKVQSDAQGFALAPEYQSLDVKAIQAAL